MFSISSFKSNVKITRPNLFFAEIVVPIGISYISNNFQFRCEATELPGRTVATNDSQSYGPTAKFAYDITYNDINLQIIASEDMAERKMFETWIDSIITPSNTQTFSKATGGIMKYYDNYASGQVRIHQLKDNGSKISTYTLYNAYPIQLSPMNLSWEDTNTYQRFSVTMTYRYHTSEFF